MNLWQRDYTIQVRGRGLCTPAPRAEGPVVEGEGPVVEGGPVVDPHGMVVFQYSSFGCFFIKLFFGDFI